MRDVLLLSIRVLAGGTLVMLFAMLGDALKPKMFAGLFSAAPSVATASLLVSGFAMGASTDHANAMGLIAGAVGLVIFSLVAAVLVKHLGSIAGSAIAWFGWAVVAVAMFGLFLR